MNMLKEVPSKPRGAKVAMFVLSLMILAITPGAASADVSGETAYVLNTLSFLMHGFLVLWMAAFSCSGWPPVSPCWRRASFGRRA
jgi:hypothetical protein